MGKIAACTVAFTPVQCENYVTEIDKVLEMIRLSGLGYVTGSFSTEVYGNAADICSLIARIYAEMDESCSFILDVRFSNVCGCNCQ